VHLHVIWLHSLCTHRPTCETSGMRLRAGSTLLSCHLLFVLVGCESPERSADVSSAEQKEQAPDTPLTPRELNQRGDQHLRAGRFAEAIADFDVFLAAEPTAESYHWQRGIAYYYAGQFEQGVRQFEVHRSVNPNDVENAVWHFLCKAQLDGADAARAALLPVGPDARVPLMQIYAMFEGRTTPAEVARAIDEASGNEADSARFYGHLYIGLYHEVMGRAGEARRHLAIAAKTRGGSAYMFDIARLHARRLADDAAK
jgi:lipoprotein NlpI